MKIRLRLHLQVIPPLVFKAGFVKKDLENRNVELVYAGHQMDTELQ